MLKRNIIFSIVILLIAIIIGQIFIHRFSQKGLETITNTKQRQKMNFCFEASLGENALKLLENDNRKDDVENTGKDSEFIAIVEPTGTIAMAPTCSWCEVTVLQIIKGKKTLHIGDNIQLMEGVQPTEAEKQNGSYLLYGAVGNFMQLNNQYLVCFDSYKKVIGTKTYEKYKLPFEQYFQVSGGWFTCLNLNETENLTTIQEGKIYPYHELETIEFFTTSPKTLKALYKTKKLIIKKLMKNMDKK